MTNKEIIKEVSKILKIDEKELATELKGKTILIRQYNKDVEGLIVAEFKRNKLIITNTNI
jgi:hypothetical protein